MTGVLADNEDLAMASNDLALVAHLLDRRTDLHIRLLLMCGFPLASLALRWGTFVYVIHSIYHAQPQAMIF